MRRAAAVAFKLGITALLVWLVTRGIELGDLAQRLATLDWVIVGAIAVEISFRFAGSEAYCVASMIDFRSAP